jgi:L-gulono-1,4-lactone dehydrogenase
MNPSASRMELFVLIVAILAGIVLLLALARFVFDHWLFGGKRLNHAPKFDPATGKWTFRNWGGNHVFTPADVVSPCSLNELLEAVDRYGRAGRRMKAVGALHSWSACAAAEDVCISMAGLNRPLSHDGALKTITAEAGIQLQALYREMDRHGLAIASIPNVDAVQLGGAISNATHGTNFSHGTMSSFVVQLQLVVFRAPEGDPSRGKAELVALRRDDPDPERRNWFEAAVASFGSLGVIYSVTMQCQEPYACVVIENTFPFDRIDGRIADLARKYYSVFLHVSSNGDCRSRIQVPAPLDLIDADKECLLTDSDLRALKVLLWAASPTATSWLWLRKALNRAVYGVSRGPLGPMLTKQRRSREGVMSWRNAELLSRIFAIAAASPWINLEYAVPVHRADEAARKLLALKKEYPVLTDFIMRPVGADTVGFLSPTRDRPTVFFDIGYHQQLMHTGVYAEIEKALLACGGRCSWSRLFKAPTEDIVRQYPLYPNFVRVKREIDPCNVFSNAFSDSILFPGLHSRALKAK